MSTSGTSPVRRPYRRPMAGWWRRDPFFVRYMVRETTALAVAVYAVILCVGVHRLAQGEAAFNGWLQALRSPASLVLHVLLLVGMIEHARSWFEIMPKTMPTPMAGGKPVAQATITRTGWLAAAVVTVLTALLAWGMR